MSETCSHLAQMTVAAPRGPKGCEECLASGGQWVHLRLCRSCGHVGCCDDSPSKHASKHYQASKHPIISSLEPGETWSWCFVDNVAFVIE